MDRFDISIVGGGVIGLAVAHALSRDRRFSECSIVILEQEDQFGQHTSSRNSEVIHAGIYYPENSLKAKLCVRGKQLLYAYCLEREIAHRRCGKLIVARAAEEGELEALLSRAQRNGVDDLSLLGKAELKRLEPEVEGDCALFSPSTGIIDSHGLMASLLAESEASGVIFARRTRLVGVASRSDGFVLDAEINDGSGAQKYQFESAALINCAGLYADSVAAMTGFRAEDSDSFQNELQLQYCKGDYFSYTGPVRLEHLVYPVPEANTVGLGIHATLDLGGQIRFGPDATYVAGIDYAIDPGKADSFASAIQRYLPSVTANQLTPSYAGIRPKLSAAGEPPADFLVQTANGEGQDRQLHLFGIESPGLTSCLAISELVVNKLALP